MSSEDTFIASLLLAQTNLYRYGGSILVVLGSVSCIMSVLVFTKKNLRKNTCSIYLVAFNISNLLLIFTIILLKTVTIGYNIDPTLYNLSFCRFRFYAQFLFDVLSPSYTILASADRVLVTSRNARTRQQSTSRLAYASITIVTVFWVLLHSHALFLTNLVEMAPNFFLCLFATWSAYNVDALLFNYRERYCYSFVDDCSGIVGRENARSVARVSPVAVVATSDTMIIRNTHADRSTDRQLRRILLIDTTVYVIFNLMMAAVLLYQEFKEDRFEDRAEVQLQSFLLVVGVFSSHIPLCTGSYTNLLASKAFRREVKKILRCR